MTFPVIMIRSVTIAEAKAHISALPSEVEAGSEVTITRNGKPVAKLVGVPTRTVREPSGWCLPGAFDPSIFSPLDEDGMREEGWSA